MPMAKVFHAAVAAVLVRSSAECSGAACAAVDAAGEEQHSLLQRGAEGTRSATSLPEAHRANSSTLQRSVQLSGANHSKACVKITGGSCAITQICDDSRSASCDTQQGSLTWGQCVCPEFTCASNGACSWSAGEIRDAVGSGATNVVEKVTATAAQIPGLADAAGAVQGVWDTLGGLMAPYLALQAALAMSGCVGANAPISSSWDTQPPASTAPASASLVFAPKTAFARWTCPEFSRGDEDQDSGKAKLT
eukprot:CAMPEP_0181504338 /NCGR_PEP_ID=MMETSP1110-20121109/57452_1 /TAXON_ID=174948 /ORGANISM="Symbiodinium sp., Strain CCMP421" /LENGTH=249 /DNA_ID=CAMNT_0023633211 /DNA_START=36 /DNA_END=782 /DNA_ORIENTATION=+